MQSDSQIHINSSNIRPLKNSTRPFCSGGVAISPNDHNWDAYLTNDHTLSDAEVTQGERCVRILLQGIYAAEGTVFGAVRARQIAVDGYAGQRWISKLTYRMKAGLVHHRFAIQS